MKNLDNFDNYLVFVNMRHYKFKSESQKNFWMKRLTEWLNGRDCHK